MPRTRAVRLFHATAAVTRPARAARLAPVAIILLLAAACTTTRPLAIRNRHFNGVDSWNKVTVALREPMRLPGDGILDLPIVSAEGRLVDLTADSLVLQPRLLKSGPREYVPVRDTTMLLRLARSDVAAVGYREADPGNTVVVVVLSAVLLAAALFFGGLAVNPPYQLHR